MNNSAGLPNSGSGGYQQPGGYPQNYGGYNPSYNSNQRGSGYPSLQWQWSYWIIYLFAQLWY